MMKIFKDHPDVSAALLQMLFHNCFIKICETCTKTNMVMVFGEITAGKTTILYRLQMGEVVSTIPNSIEASKVFDEMTERGIEPTVVIYTALIRGFFSKDTWDECVITVYLSEASDDLNSMAVEAHLLLQAKINDEEEGNITFGLLVSSKVIGCIIGKSGSIINEIRKRTKADVQISKGNKPKSAGNNDELVEVVGDVGSVRDALVQIVLRLRHDVLKDSDGGRSHSAGADPLYSGGTGLSMSSVLPPMPPHCCVMIK